MDWSLIVTQRLFLAVLASVIPPLVGAGDTDGSLATKIVILGTQGGPVPGVKRAQPASAVVVGGRTTWSMRATELFDSSCLLTSIIDG